MADEAPIQWIRSARLRVTVDCPECAAPIPVNGVVPQVLCGACQAVVELRGPLAWKRILRYRPGEGCKEHGILMHAQGVAALDYLLGFSKPGGRLHRRFEAILLEIDDRAPACHGCGTELDATALAAEVEREGDAVDAFCPGCGAPIPLRPAGHDDQRAESNVVAVVGETALRGDLHEPESTETVLFSCLGCGAALDVDASAPRLLTCEYCRATNYLPDALWLRLHPAQRKRPFWMLVRMSASEVERIREIID